MTLPIEVSAEASTELDSAAMWYAARRPGLGTEFVNAVDDALEAISAWPHAGSPVHDTPHDLEIRRAPVARYPYHVAYLVLDDRVRILAVAHDRRRPTYWAPRARR